MFRFLADENFNNDIVRGMLLRLPTLDVVRVQDVGLLGAEDEAVLEWAAVNNRILLSHDRATLPDLAYDRVAAGRVMPGVLSVHNRLAVGQAIDQILLVVGGSTPDEYAGVVFYIPMKSTTSALC